MFATCNLTTKDRHKVQFSSTQRHLQNAAIAVVHVFITNKAWPRNQQQQGHWRFGRGGMLATRHRRLQHQRNGKGANAAAIASKVWMDDTHGSARTHARTHARKHARTHAHAHKQVLGSCRVACLTRKFGTRTGDRRCSAHIDIFSRDMQLMLMWPLQGIKTAHRKQNTHL